MTLVINRWEHGPVVRSQVFILEAKWSFEYTVVLMIEGVPDSPGTTLLMAEVSQSIAVLMTGVVPDSRGTADECSNLECIRDYIGEAGISSMRSYDGTWCICLG